MTVLANEVIEQTFDKRTDDITQNAIKMLVDIEETIGILTKTMNEYRDIDAHSNREIIENLDRKIEKLEGLHRVASRFANKAASACLTERYRGTITTNTVK